MAEKRGRGKPKRYEGEDSSRLSILVRPRYKQLIELVAKDRQSTLSEALEFIVATFGRYYLTDNIPIIDFVRSKFERLGKYWELMLPSDPTKRQPFINYAKCDYYNNIKKYPRSTLTKEDLFLLDALSPIYDDLFLSFKFANKLLTQEVKEDWRIGRSPIEVTADLGFLIYLVETGKEFTYQDFLIHNEIDSYETGPVPLLAHFLSDKKLDKEIGTKEYIAKYTNINELSSLAAKNFRKAMKTTKK